MKRWLLHACCEMFGLNLQRPLQEAYTVYYFERNKVIFKHNYCSLLSLIIRFSFLILFTFIYLFFYKTQMNDVAFSVSLINLLHVTKFKHYESLVLTRIPGPERHMNLQDQEKKQKQKSL